jgi:hypothetical protein
MAGEIWTGWTGLANGDVIPQCLFLMGQMKPIRLNNFDGTIESSTPVSAFCSTGWSFPDKYSNIRRWDFHHDKEGVGQGTGCTD